VETRSKVFCVLLAVLLPLSFNQNASGDTPSIPEGPAPSPTAAPPQEEPPQQDPPEQPAPPEPGECNAYQVTIVGLPHSESGKADIISSAGTHLTCLQRMLDDCVNQWVEIVGSASILTPYSAEGKVGVGDLGDDCLQAKLDNLLRVSGARLAAMDHNCTPLNGVAEGQLCAEVEVRYITSPISLVWNPGAPVRSKLSFVQFELVPNVFGRWYEWRASGDTPLLVYDPEHTGKITSGAQLFGNYTFGGVKAASLASTAAAAPWNNGFEALATLDSDGDEKLAGDELAPLALWFDYNQDGISQPGEVKRLEEVQVTSLSVVPDEQDPRTRDIIAAAGYERIADGRKVTGAMVDWYSASAGSYMQALAGRQLPEAGAE